MSNDLNVDVTTKRIKGDLNEAIGNKLVMGIVNVMRVLTSSYLMSLKINFGNDTRLTRLYQLLHWMVHLLVVVVVVIVVVVVVVIVVVVVVYFPATFVAIETHFLYVWHPT